MSKKIKKLNKNYLQFVASFMIALILTMPFYVSNVIAAIDRNNPLSKNSLESITGAQIVPPSNLTSILSIDDAVQSCIEKNEKTHALVDALDNDIIKVLEQIFSVLHAINAGWEFFKQGLNTYILGLYAAEPLCGWCAAQAERLEDWRNFIDNPGSGGLAMLINYVLGCKNPVVSWCEQWGPYDIGSDIKVTISKSPYNNIYVAFACLCVPAILFNMRKLKTIYQTYNCCVEQACQNGISVEACERQLSEATCMYWGKGAVLSALLGIGISIAAQIIAQVLMKKLVEKYIPQLARLFGTLISLANLPFAYENLREGLKWMDKTFSEPKCEDLGFDKLRGETQKELKFGRKCVSTRVDTNGDGIADGIDTVCA